MPNISVQQTDRTIASVNREALLPCLLLASALSRIDYMLAALN